MEVFTQLQDWYLAQCNGDREHGYGISIRTLDNPGWSLEVELTDSDLDGLFFAPVSYGVGAEAIEDDPNWLICKVEGNKFTAYGGPLKLNEMVHVFVSWAAICRSNNSSK